MLIHLAGYIYFPCSFRVTPFSHKYRIFCTNIILGQKLELYYLSEYIYKKYMKII
jgi:hypothetical protein